MPLNPVDVRRWTSRTNGIQSQLSITDHDFVRAAVDTMAEFHQYLLGTTLQQAGEWLRRLSTWPKKQQGALDRAANYRAAATEVEKKRYEPVQYKPGDVVMVDFGVGLHVEISYPHPMLILVNGWYTVTGLPMTRTPPRNKHQIVSNFDGVKGTIMVDQIVTVSKERIIRVMGDLRDQAEYDEALNMVMKIYVPRYYDELRHLRQKNRSLERQVMHLRNTMQRMRATSQAAASRQTGTERGQESVDKPRGAD